MRSVTNFKKALINGVLRDLRYLSRAWGRAPQGVNQRFLKFRIYSFYYNSAEIILRLLVFKHTLAIFVSYGSCHGFNMRKKSIGVKVVKRVPSEKREESLLDKIMRKLLLSERVTYGREPEISRNPRNDSKC
jgi:hypothetical protein